MKTALLAWPGSDAISPMLVKELRQGIKSKSFMFAFLLMQGLMVFSVLMYLTAIASRQDASGYNGMFWFCLGATLIIIMPLRAMGALGQEIRGNTIELIFLTRLGSWRIVAGKWLALYSQSLLIAAGTLPYLLVRYFIGGINVSDDVYVMFWLLVSSAVLIAVGVCLSTFAIWLRILVIVGAFIFSMTWAVRGVVSHFGGPSPSASAGPFTFDTVMPFVLQFVRSVLLVLLFLAWSASRVAPPAENFSKWKRLLALVFVALLAPGASGIEIEYLVLGSLLVLVPICTDALGEKACFFPSIYRPFARRGLPGRLAGLFLYPGWQSGVLFTLLAGGLLFGVASCGGHLRDPHKEAMFAALPGALIMPLALVMTFRPGIKNIMAGYLGIQITFIVITIIGLILHDVFSDLTLLPLSFIPTSALILHLVEEGDDPSWMPVTACVTAFALVVLIVRMRPVFRRIRQTERASVAPPA